jgi:hypothetical protein
LHVYALWGSGKPILQLAQAISKCSSFEIISCTQTGKVVSIEPLSHTARAGQEFCSLLAGPSVIAMMQGLGQDTVPAEL